MSTVFITLYENYTLILILFFISVGILISFSLELNNKQIEPTQHPMLLFKSGRFIRQNFNKVRTEERVQIKQYLLRNYGSMKSIKVIILDEHGQLIVFTEAHPNNPNLIDGIRLSYNRHFQYE